jgi:hypothetical protein
MGDLVEVEAVGVEKPIRLQVPCPPLQWMPQLLPSLPCMVDYNLTHLLKLHCPDAGGLLARIAGFIAASGGNLLDVS